MTKLNSTNSGGLLSSPDVQRRIDELSEIISELQDIPTEEEDLRKAANLAIRGQTILISLME